MDDADTKDVVPQNRRTPPKRPDLMTPESVAEYLWLKGRFEAMYGLYCMVPAIGITELRDEIRIMAEKLSDALTDENVEKKIKRERAKFERKQTKLETSLKQSAQHVKLLQMKLDTAERAAKQAAIQKKGK